MKDFTKIIHEFHKDYIEAVTQERYGVELPLKLGKHMVVSYRSKRPYPAFRGPFDRNPLVYLNNATDGLKCKLVFTNSDHRYRVKDRYIWSFEPEVNFKKAVSKAFVQNHKNYIFSHDNQEAKSRQWDLKSREITDARIAKFLLTYDEFKID